MQIDWEKDASEKNGETGMTRRDLFGLAGVAIAAAAIPVRFGMTHSQSDETSAPAKPVLSAVTAKLSEYMAEAGDRPLPANVVQATKEHILDTFSAMISGSNLLPGRKGIEFARKYGGKPVSTVVASDVVCGPIEAALANAMLAHADETDDSSSAAKCHPGCGIVPAALAFGELCGTNGTRFIRAVALGYDVGNRVTLTLGGRAFEVNSHWSTHTIAPIFGAAAACGCIGNMNPQQMRWLLSYTCQQSSGLGAWDRDSQHIQKAFVFGGMGARGGVTSAILVQDGWTGVDDLFSGPDNFFDAYKPSANPAGLIDKLGEVYQITQTDIKKWPVGSPIQAVLDALEILQKKHSFTADDVRQVTVQLAPTLGVIVDNRKMPDICLQQMVAVMLMDRTVGFRSANDVARMKDPATLRQRAKVKYVPSEELQRILPVRAAIVDITLNDGTHLTERVDHVRGSFENPMTSQEVADKFRDLVTPVLGEATTAALIDKIYNLENVNDIRELRPLLQKS